MGKFEVFEGYPEHFNFNVEADSYAIADSGTLGTAGIGEVSLAVMIYNDRKKIGGLAYLAITLQQIRLSPFEEMVKRMLVDADLKDLEASLAGEKDSSEIRMSPLVMQRLEQYKIPIIGTDLAGSGFFSRIVFLDVNNGNIRVYRTTSKMRFERLEA